MELTPNHPSARTGFTVNKEQFSGQVTRIPSRAEIAPIVNEQLIVELYSR
jgi:small subunit ribosomal protein S4